MTMSTTPESNEAVKMEVVSQDAIQQITKAEIDIQIATAHRFPRSLSKFKQKALEMATLDEETAESCFYCLPRAGKEIQGPSARLAEIVASAWGNLRAGARVISNDGKTITAQAVSHDLETNTCITIETKRKITDKSGRTFSEDMQVTSGNAACSIALRNSLFKVIPFAYIRQIYEQAKKTAIGDASTLVQRRSKAFEHFTKMGVVENRILSAIGKAKMEDVDLSDLEKLTGIKTAIKEGDISIDEAFPVKTEVKTPSFVGKTKKASDPVPQSGEKTEAINPPNDGSKTRFFNAFCQEKKIEIGAMLNYLGSLGYSTFEDVPDNLTKAINVRPDDFIRSMGVIP